MTKNDGTIRVTATFAVKSLTIPIEGFPELTELYLHVRDEHGLPLHGEWEATALIELHRTLHDIEGKD